MPDCTPLTRGRVFFVYATTTLHIPPVAGRSEESFLRQAKTCWDHGTRLCLAERALHSTSVYSAVPRSNHRACVEPEPLDYESLYDRPWAVSASPVSKKARTSMMSQKVQVVVFVETDRGPCTAVEIFACFCGVEKAARCSWRVCAVSVKALHCLGRNGRRLFFFSPQEHASVAGERLDVFWIGARGL